MNKTIFDYFNYREFLHDWYQSKKAANPAFSYQLIAQKAGFKSKSLIAGVLGGSRHLSTEGTFRIAKVVGLEAKAFAYFQDMVAFARAKSAQEQDVFLQRLMHYNHKSPVKTLLKSQYEFYTQWYHATIRHIITTVDFKEDYEQLAALVFPPISARQAIASVKLLQSLGLVRREQGHYVLTDKAITTGDEIRALAVGSYHRQVLALAAESIETVDSTQRELCAVSGTLSAEGFLQAKREIQEFRRRMAQLMDSDTGAERVYHFNFQLFPTSAPLTDGLNHTPPKDTTDVE